MTYGLFGVIGEKGTVSDITINRVNGIIPSSEDKGVFCGAICGINYGKIENCITNSGMIKGEQKGELYCSIGGIAGWNIGGTIVQCENGTEIKTNGVDNPVYSHMGGVIGAMLGGNVEYSKNTGVVYNYFGGNTGGIVGRCSRKFCYKKLFESRKNNRFVYGRRNSRLCR